MIVRSLSCGGIAVLLAASQAAGQDASAARASPPGRAHHTLFYDEARQRVVLTGGAANDARRNVTVFDDLWSFDGAGWTALPPSGDAIWGSGVAVDASKRVHAFGGVGESPVGDLRVLEGDRWRKIGVHPSIVAVEPGFVFDAARDRFVTFGGGAGSGRLNGEVWEFDGARWSRHAASPPPARGAHAMVYDAGRRKVVLFGGMGVRTGAAPAPMLGDTWEFDGSTWTPRPVPGPPARLGAGIAYDAKRARVLLFGGANHERVFDDLWSWDGTSWTKLAEGGPEPRVMGYIAYDRMRDRIVLFGGRRRAAVESDLGDTWEWDGARWRRVGR